MTNHLQLVPLLVKNAWSSTSTFRIRHHGRATVVSRYSDWQQAGRSGFRDWEFFTASKLAVGSTQPPMQWVQGRETDQSPPSAKV
jgi:hypothetical protein